MVKRWTTELPRASPGPTGGGPGEKTMTWCGGKNQKPETGGSVGQQCGSEIII